MSTGRSDIFDESFPDKDNLVNPVIPVDPDTEPEKDPAIPPPPPKLEPVIPPK